MSEKPTTRITTDHVEIKRWIEEHGGRPAQVKDADKGNGAEILRVDIIKGDGPEESLEEISWEDFFNAFEKKRLAFLYDTNPKMRFSKFISRD